MKSKNVVGIIAVKLIKSAAINAVNSASFAGFYQPKETEALKKLKK